LLELFTYSIFRIKVAHLRKIMLSTGVFLVVIAVIIVKNITMETKIPKILLHIDTSRSCGRGILIGVARYSKEHGPWQISQRPPLYTYQNPQKASVLGAEDWLADAMIVSTTEIPPEVIKAKIPVVGIDVHKKIYKCPNIVGDADAIALMAADYFLNKGFTNFAYCGFKDIDWSIQRGVSFKKVLAQRGHQVNSFVIKEKPANVLWDEQLLDLGQWLKDIEKPVAVFACNDDCGGAVMQACQSVSLDVPGDVVVLGVDNDEMVCMTSSVALSSIALNFEKAGFETAALLDKMVSKKQNKFAESDIILSPTHIVTRASTDVLAIQDKQLSQALSFISKYCRQPIQVVDVVEAVGLSRRNLEYKFSKTLKRSINAEIRRVKVEQITKMLIETDIPVTQIALYFGFSDATHIARYFSKEKNITPKDYRKKVKL